MSPDLYIPGRMSRRSQIAAALALLLGSFAVAGACGSQGIQVAKTDPYYRGAVLFRDHCSGCHTLSSVGAQGSATSIKDRLRTNGPNFNVRKENEEQVLYAIRNGGFSGAIMPENIVLGDDAKEVAAFLAKYSGLKAEKVPTVQIPQSQ
jgi:mono/diheme cytochrome c family protein